MRYLHFDKFEQPCIFLLLAQGFLEVVLRMSELDLTMANTKHMVRV